MKKRVHNIILIVLTVVGICLIVFSIWGLLSYLRFEDMSNASNGTPVMQQVGDNPDIDSAIRDEMNRILKETDFSYQGENHDRPYTGSHCAEFSNTSGVNFETLHLLVSLYQLDHPEQYGDDDRIPSNPIHTFDVYSGPLKNGQSVPISFVSNTDDYNFLMFGYEYAIAEE